MALQVFKQSESLSNVVYFTHDTSLGMTAQTKEGYIDILPDTDASTVDSPFYAQVGNHSNHSNPIYSGFSDPFGSTPSDLGPAYDTTSSLYDELPSGYDMLQGTRNRHVTASAIPSYDITAAASVSVSREYSTLDTPTSMGHTVGPPVEYVSLNNTTFLHDSYVTISGVYNVLDKRTVPSTTYHSLDDTASHVTTPQEGYNTLSCPSPEWYATLDNIPLLSGAIMSLDRKPFPSGYVNLDE